MLDNKLHALILFVALGLCPLLAGLGFFWVSGQRSVVTCTRLESTHVDCQIDRAFLGLIPSDQLTITRVTGTEIETSCGDDGCTYAVNLLSDEGFVPLSDLAISDLDSVEADQARINEFLDDPESDFFEYRVNPAWLGMMISLPFILLGVLVIGAGLKTLIKNISSHNNV